MSEDKPKKRELTNLTLDVFKDQLKMLKDISNETGTSKAALVRQAIDKVYPRKKKILTP